MNVFLAGNKITLSSSDFVQQGGEGAVYVKGKVAYKVYHNPGHMIPLGKMHELGKLTLPNIIKPEQVLADASGRPVGYTMRAVPNSWNMQQLFPPVFRAREGLTAIQVTDLIEKLRLGTEHVHRARVLIVDLNELNFLVSRDFRELYFIDVNSYQTPGYPATAIMDSIRDRFMKRPTEGSDWFSFAVITFQLFTGMHPFRGKHPSLKDDLDARMRAQISVLDPSVKVPPSCLPFTVIPDDYRLWYERVFHHGDRSAPPPVHGAPIIVVPAIRQRSGDFIVLTEYAMLPSDVIDFYGGDAVCASGIYSGGKLTACLRFGGRIGVTPKHRRKVVARLGQAGLEIYDTATQSDIAPPAGAEAMMQVGGRLYVKNGQSIYEVTFTELPNRTLASMEPVGNVMERATQLFDGVAVQQMVGSCFLSVFPETRTCHQVRVSELDAVRVLDAKFERGVAVLTGQEKGVFRRYVVRFSKDYQQYDLRVSDAEPGCTANFTVLDKGMVVSIIADEQLEVFLSKVGSKDVKIVKDSGIDVAMRLYSMGDTVYCNKAGTIWHMSMGGGA